MVVETIGAFKKEFTEEVKQKIESLAKRNGWMFDQTQYAEDYIDKISRGKTRDTLNLISTRTIGLNPNHARIIRDVIKGLKKKQKWHNNAWEKSSS